MVSFPTSLPLVFAVLAAVAAASFGLVERRARKALQNDREQLRHKASELKAANDALGKAEAANEAKSRFLAMVSHEVRNP